MDCEEYRERAAYWYQELLTARNEYERRLCQRQLRPLTELLGKQNWQPIRDRVKNNVKRGRIQRTWFFKQPERKAK
ncbi:hypothetical protein [Wielerella bovis]|uniref:hypothetical protein n=1 Tax=Wielerella bovis TaxID=2917790 RepID=UPI00201938F6|nr:hypothetical protein [Wielerella bovis]ULJ66661.1 hypothetical protein MIS31_10495 [Wielerella bovis]